MTFVRRWKYTITWIVLLVGSTLLLVAVQPENWWVPGAFSAAMLANVWFWSRRRWPQ